MYCEKAFEVSWLVLKTWVEVITVGGTSLDYWAFGKVWGCWGCEEALNLCWG